jgi:beta-mannanase
MRYQNPTDPYTIANVNLWQGKRTAVSTVFRKTNFPIADLVTKLKEVWYGGAVPVYSIDIIDSNAFIAGGGLDPRLDAIGAALTTFLAGPDGVYGNADDRRIFLRPAWEANGNWYAWSPCTATGGPASDYRAMFRRIHDRFTLAGMDSRDSAWIFSVNQADWPTNTCAMEDLYPGDAYVDWLGLDAYTRSAYDSPEVAFTPMVNRLRALAPGKPVSVNEAGVSSRVKVGKSAYVTSYFKWVADNDIRMVAWFNNDNTNGDWTVYGGTLGDESILGALTSTLAWSSYRVAVSDPRYVGSSLTNPRLLTDAQFMGR